ncbi:MAG TPA: sigma-70 family RNA polymerase sigma factor [Anaerolineae bacterium]|nr:sigma-70 family RNA polymerase sigma factor [Anaerolineae bacterium]HOQ97452.1 sigma-70 family RNA polymerase sigma factor [Anaerolineae bacterium]HPL30573.1 sigma-70 family RNA polymerase sigma factor [Anaerolineae bacterium]
MVDEHLLAQRALAGDQAAFAELVHAYQGPVYNLAYRMLGTAAEAEEAAQETFVRVYRRLDTYDPQLKFSSWILSIASHYCVDRLRRRRIVPLSLEEEQVEPREPADEAPERRLLAAEREQEIQGLLAQLPEAYRIVLVLRYWHDLSYQEIANTLGTSESAIKAKLHRARESMAQHLARRQATQPTSGLERRVTGHALPRSA